jgi:opacity protein-like surface antigen
MALSVAARAGAQPPAAAARTDQLSTEAGVGSPSSAAGVVSYRHGWYLGVAPVIADLHQDALQSLGKAVRFAETGAGARFLVGYAFTESFALELSLLGAGFATDQPGVDGAMANVALDAVAHLRPGRALQPYLTGGLGAVAVGIDGGGFPRQSRQGGQADVGAGLELHVARHFALAADYRYALHGFQREVTRVDPVETRVDIDAQGHAHTWGLRCVYSF